MPSPSPKPVLLLAGVAATMALLVGLVGSARRAATSVRELGPPAPWNMEPWTGGPTETVLTPPRTVAGDEPAPSVAHEVAPRLVGQNQARGADTERERLTGLVLRPDGLPAAGARVKLGGQQTRCSVEGRFHLRLEAGLEGEDLVAHLEGFEPALVPRFHAAATSPEVRLVLGAETLVLTGTLVDPGGQPLKGWTVELDGPDPLRDHGLREPVRTDHDGGFALADVPAGVHVVRAWKKQRELGTLSAPAVAGELGLRIVAVSGE